MMLSVCIPYHERDTLSYNRLVVELNRMAETGGYNVAFLSIPNKGERKRGWYRQHLLENVMTKYVTFIDADDRVSSDYFFHVYKGIEQGALGIGFKGQITTNGRNPFTFVHSTRYPNWHEKRVNGKLQYFRPLNHLNPMLTEIALKIGYNTELHHGEDLDFSNRLKASGLISLKDEYFVDSIMYHYLYRNKK